MMETTAEIASSLCEAQLLRGEWPKPLERHVWKDDRLVVSMLFRDPAYKAEAHYTGTPFSAVGDIFLVPPGQELFGRGTGGKFRALRCIFDPARLRETLDVPSLDGVNLARSLNLGTADIMRLMDRLAREIAAPGFAAIALVESVSTTILIECLNQLFGPDADATPQRGRITARHLRLIDEYLDQLENAAPSIAEIARLCSFNPHYFSLLFRNQMGQSLGRYLTDAQCTRAEQLLARTDMPLKEVAHRLGFSNAANFSNAFRTRRHLTPGQYRQTSRAPAIRTSNVPTGN
jgi:AraC family transcriptional regulator